MKVIKKILFLFLIFLSFISYGQIRFPVPQNIGSKSTQVHVPGLLVTDSGFVLKEYIDTIAANIAQVGFNGSLIKVDSSLFLYNKNKWVKISDKKILDSLPLSIRINNNTTAININTTAIATKQAVLISGDNIKTINGVSILGSGNITINSSQNLQQVTNNDSITTHQIIAKSYNASDLPIYESNSDAVAANLKNGDFYYLPYNNGNYLLAIVVRLTTLNMLLSNSGTPILTNNNTPILTN